MNRSQRRKNHKKYRKISFKDIEAAREFMKARGHLFFSVEGTTLSLEQLTEKNITDFIRVNYGCKLEVSRQDVDGRLPDEHELKDISNNSDSDAATPERERPLHQQAPVNANGKGQERIARATQKRIV